MPGESPEESALRNELFILNPEMQLFLVYLLVSSSLAADKSVFANRAALTQVDVSHAGEGPAWNRATKTLYFTGDNKITRIHPDGKPDIYREPSGGANGLLFDK